MRRKKQKHMSLTLTEEVSMETDTISSVISLKCSAWILTCCVLWNGTEKRTELEMNRPTC